MKQLFGIRYNSLEKDTKWEEGKRRRGRRKNRDLAHFRGRGEIPSTLPGEDREAVEK